MFIKLICLMSFLTISLNAIAQQNAYQEEYAGNLNAFSFETMEAESDQMRALAEWQESLVLVEKAKIKESYTKKNLERTLALDQKDVVSKEKVVIVKMEHLAAENEVKKLSHMAEKFRLTYEEYRLKLIALNNPERAIKKEIIETQIKAQVELIESLKVSKNLSIALHEVILAKYKNGLSLKEKSAISEADLDSRAQNAAMAKNEIQLIEQKIKVAEVKLNGLKLSLSQFDRLK